MRSFRLVHHSSARTPRASTNRTHNAAMGVTLISRSWAGLAGRPRPPRRRPPKHAPLGSAPRGASRPHEIHEATRRSRGEQQPARRSRALRAVDHRRSDARVQPNSWMPHGAKSSRLRQLQRQAARATTHLIEHLNYVLSYHCVRAWARKSCWCRPSMLCSR